MGLEEILIEDAREEGKQEGRQEGKDVAIRLVIQNMLENGFLPEFVASAIKVDIQLVLEVQKAMRSKNGASPTSGNPHN